ncbi:MAG: hypothetical protein H2045_11280 [Rhizobiales bacterium]|nr:hypothetical protein [Hyphomicrobiales bacterium]
MIFGSYNRKRKADPEYEAKLGREMMERPERFIQSILFDSQDRKISGFKFKTDEAFNPDFRAYTDALVGDTDIKVIHLMRRNLVDQYISHWMVLNQTGVTLIHSEDQRPKMQPFKADIDHAIEYCREVVAREKQSIELYGGHRSIKVVYENLVEKDEHRAETLNFLGVPIRPLETGIKKIIKDSRALVLNFDDLVDGLRRAGLAGRLS